MVVVVMMVLTLMISPVLMVAAMTLMVKLPPLTGVREDEVRGPW
jgi:hypothetical protein